MLLVSGNVARGSEKGSVSTKQKHRILCQSCNAFLYVYEGDFTGKFYLTQFKPAKPTVPTPRPGEAMLCLFCGSAWYALRTNGAIFVLTENGWKPKAPSGMPPMRLSEAVSRTLMPELPPEMRNRHGDFKE